MRSPGTPSRSGSFSSSSFHRGGSRRPPSVDEGDGSPSASAMRDGAPALPFHVNPMVNTLSQSLSGIIVRELRTLQREIEAYPDDAVLWRLPPGAPNSGGT